jgi:hypothetical protein
MTYSGSECVDRGQARAGCGAFHRSALVSGESASYNAARRIAAAVPRARAPRGTFPSLRHPSLRRGMDRARPAAITETIMSKKSLRLPAYVPKYASDTEVDYGEFRASIERQLDAMPEFVRALKKADNEGWQQLVEDLTRHIQTDPKLAAFIRERTKDGATGLSIGEPNWFWVPVVAAFAAGYALGTACYKAGPCKFV